MGLTSPLNNACFLEFLAQRRLPVVSFDTPMPDLFHLSSGLPHTPALLLPLSVSPALTCSCSPVASHQPPHSTLPHPTHRHPRPYTHTTITTPLLPPGLTNDTRELDADPDRISKSIQVPDTEGLVTLEAAGDGGGGLLLRHQPDGTVALVPQVCDSEGGRVGGCVRACVHTCMCGVAGSGAQPSQAATPLCAGPVALMMQ